MNSDYQPEEVTPNLGSISLEEKQWLEAFLDISLSNPPTTMAKAMLNVGKKLAKLEAEINRLKGSQT